MATRSSAWAAPSWPSRASGDFEVVAPTEPSGPHARGRPHRGGPAPVGHGSRGADAARGQEPRTAASRSSSARAPSSSGARCVPAACPRRSRTASPRPATSLSAPTSPTTGRGVPGDASRTRCVADNSEMRRSILPGPAALRCLQPGPRRAQRRALRAWVASSTATRSKSRCPTSRASSPACSGCAWAPTTRWNQKYRRATTSSTPRASSSRLLDGAAHRRRSASRSPSASEYPWLQPGRAAEVSAGGEVHWLGGQHPSRQPRRTWASTCPSWPSSSPSTHLLRLAQHVSSPTSGRARRFRRSRTTSPSSSTRTSPASMLAQRITSAGGKLLAERPPVSTSTATAVRVGVGKKSMAFSADVSRRPTAR